MGGEEDDPTKDYCSVAPPNVLTRVDGGDCGRTSGTQCGNCEGDCDRDANDCQDGLECFIRGDNTPIPGCIAGYGGTQRGRDYCYDPNPGPTPGATTTTTTTTTSNEEPAADPIPLTLGSCRSSNPCGNCEGDCDNDDQCAGSLRCFYRRGNWDTEDDPVPGCLVGGSDDDPGEDYCSHAPPNAISKPSGGCTTSSPCKACEGNCDGNDEKCEGDLKCKERNSNERVPGCVSGYVGTEEGTDYCYDPDEPTNALEMVDHDGDDDCSTSFRCNLCQGDCDRNSHCNAGFKCFKRDGHTAVPGCASGYFGDKSGKDYCIPEELFA